MKDYCADNPVILAGRIVFTFTVILTMPLQIFSSREAITTILYKYVKFTRWIHASVTAGILILCFVPAILIDQIEDVMSFAGALVAAPIVLILPGLCLLLLMKQGLVVNNLTKIGCYVIVVVGFLILIGGTAVSVYTFFEPKHQKIQYWCKPDVKTELYSPKVADLGSLLEKEWIIEV